MKLSMKDTYLGFGLGLRSDHYETILQDRPSVDWFEIITENYLIPGGKPLYYLDRIREHYPFVMHGVSLSLGSAEPLDLNYLREVKKLADRIQPKWISDHLCWTGINGLNMHDLLPLPYTEEAIKQVVSHIQQTQEILGRKILIENVSSYVEYHQSEMTEWEFLSEIVKRADCHILLDVNNVYVSAFNHHFNPIDYLKNIPAERVQQIHLAGHSNHGDYIIDTHDAPIIQEVWDLYADALKIMGPVSTMIERDDGVPSLQELLDELKIAKKVFNELVTVPVIASGAWQSSSEHALFTKQNSNTGLPRFARNDGMNKPSPNLVTVQKNFQSYFLKNTLDIHENIKIKNRLDIYRDAYFSRLLEVLHQDYPVLHELLGDEKFNQLGQQYIAAYPSSYRSIRWYGKELPDFMRKNHFNDGLIEMADFERLLTNAFDSADDEAISADEMSQISAEKWPTLKFIFHSSLQRINLKWNTVINWHSRKNKNPELLKESIDWVIWRKNHEVQFHSLSVDEVFVLDAMLSGKSFSFICEGLREWIDEQDISLHAAKILKHFILEKMIIKII